MLKTNDSKRVIELLIRYYETGDLHDFDTYSIEWLREQNGRIDFINGFIEVYGDPMGLKGSWEGIVEYKDLKATHRTQTISLMHSGLRTIHQLSLCLGKRL